MEGDDRVADFLLVSRGIERSAIGYPVKHYFNEDFCINVQRWCKKFVLLESVSEKQRH